VTKIRYSGDDSNIQDQGAGNDGGSSSGGLGGLGSILSGGGGGGGGGLSTILKGGGGLMGILLLVATVVLPKLLHGGLGNTPSATSGSSAAGTPSGGAGVQINSPGLSPAAADTAEGSATPASQDSSGGTTSVTCGSTELRKVICGAYEDTTQYWKAAFTAAGRQFVQPKMVFFTSNTNTGCGAAESSAGPFYCPADQKIYLDLAFLQKLETQLKFGGDLAEQYVIAHEYGHHIQNLLGTSDAVEQADRQHPDQANAISVKLELQADCFAGMWVKSAQDRNLLEPGDMNEALGAAHAVGDDTIQQEMQGRVNPDTFTHGTSAQRQSWFNQGVKFGDTNKCNTFAE
jgi:uncharacterized protein